MSKNHQEMVKETVCDQSELRKQETKIWKFKKLFESKYGWVKKSFL